MEKRISQKNKKKFGLLVSSLDNVENIVPNQLKTVFNFKGRKSPKIAYKAILALSDPDDIIYDPFMGSGAFVIAAAQAGRKIVATEIDNYTYSAVYTLLAKIDNDKFQKLFNMIEKSVKSSIMDLYETQCCGIKNYISKLLYDPETQEYFNPHSNREIKDGKNIKLVSKCPICGEKQKKFDNFDQKQLEYTNKLDVSAFPHIKYIENSRINITSSTGADYYDRIFTVRNKKALLLIQEAISSLDPSIERDVLEHSLVSTLSLARITLYGSSTDILYHVVPYSAQEMNVWHIFENKVYNFLSFKENFQAILEIDPSSNERYQINLSSFQNFCSNDSQKEKYDLIYTDFPYTDQVPYLERNQLYRIWLNRFYDQKNFLLTEQMLNDEIVQTNAPSRPQKQNIKTYYKDLDNMFNVFNKILKTHGLVTLTVKLGKSKYFTTLIEIINLARKNGFEYCIRLGIDKNDPSIRKQSAYKNTLSNEMIIIFEKLSSTDRYWYVNNKNYEFETTKIIYNLIQKKDDLNISYAVKCVQDILRQKQNYFTQPEDLLIIRKIIQKNFIVDANTAIVRIDSNKLYLDIEDKTDLFTKFYEYIPIIIRHLLEEKGKFVLDDLYFEIANNLCTGNPETINQFLDDPKHQSSINRLINNYCTSNGKVYEKKIYSSVISKEALDISMLTGAEFESLVKTLLEKENYIDILNTGGSGDLGVDLLAKKIDENGDFLCCLFQCKRWASNVGSEPMQRLVAERLRRNADVAICITTSNYTLDGQKIANEQNIGAWNGEDVIRKLDLYFPNKYYNGICNY